MKEIEEKIPEAEDAFGEWEKEKAEQSKYFKPQEGEGYDVVIQSFIFGKKSFKPGEPEKWTMTCKLLSVNGKLISQEWNTGSATIIKALQPFKKKQDELARIIWRLKKLKKGDHTEYVFENIGRVGATPSPSKGEKAEAFL